MVLSKENIDYVERTHVRVSLELECKIVLDGKNHTGMTGNLSLGGMYLKMVSPEFKPTDITYPVAVVLQLGTFPVIFSCRIVYINNDSEYYPEGAGVTFDEGQDEEVEKLKHYILACLDA